jgi:hypothetical protein
MAQAAKGRLCVNHPCVAIEGSEDTGATDGLREMTLARAVGITEPSAGATFSAPRPQAQNQLRKSSSAAIQAFK